MTNQKFSIAMILVLLIGLAPCAKGVASEQKKSAPPASKSGPDFEKLLNVTDVEKVSHLKKIKLAPKDPAKRLYGDLNFLSRDGMPVLVVIFGDAEAYSTWKDEAKQAGAYQDEVSGVGDEAFEAGDSSVLYFRKGNRSVQVGSGLDAELASVLNQKQLLELAKIMLSRL